MVEYLSQGLSMLMLLCAVLGGACVSLSVLYIRMVKQQAPMRAIARKRAWQLAEALRMFRMAEGLAGLGVWQYSPSNGQQRWSQGMKTLFGVEPQEELMPGDMETLLSANGIDLVEQVSAAAQAGDELATQFKFNCLDGHPKVLNVRGCRTHNRKGETRNLTAVVMDVTDQAQQVVELEHSRELAMKEAREARELAETDPLTGIANRRRAMAVLDQMVMRSRQTSQTLALIIFDIDHFKLVNDRYGHPAGDAVLKRIAQVTCEQARKNDVVGRIGGEEFVWIIPDANLGLARVISERLRQAIAFGSGVGDVPPVTVSVGFASPEVGDTGLTLFARADAALYEAKHAGSNTVRMAA